jgi:hypothetical protein
VTEMDDLIIKKSTIETLFKLSLDRLSICFNEPNEESVKKKHVALFLAISTTTIRPESSLPRINDTMLAARFLFQVTQKGSKPPFALRLVHVCQVRLRSALISIRASSLQPGCVS